MPSFGMYTLEGTLANWLFPSGAQVEKGQPVLEIETEKATQEVLAPAAGCLHHVAKLGDPLKVEDLIGYILEDGEATPANEPPSAPRQTPTGTPIAARIAPVGREIPARLSRGRVVATPRARRVAAEYGLDLRQLAGTGPGGRIVEADVRDEIEGGTGQQGSRPSALAAGLDVAERVPLSAMRLTIGERLGHSLRTAVSLTLTREITADSLAAARRSLSQKTGISIPFDAFLVRFLAEALREQPELNTVIEGRTALRLRDTHIGVAVSVAGGLVVPVIRHPAELSLAEVAQSIRRLAEQAISGKIQQADLQGASSTVSNLGRFGVDAFTPVLNPPQATILGVGRIRPRPVARDGAIVVANTCVLSLTFDHRVTDGVPAALLLDGIAQRMTDESYLASIA